MWLVHLRLRDHQETIWFVVTPKMAKEMILGLACLKKWGENYLEKASGQMVMKKPSPKSSKNEKEKPKQRVGSEQKPGAQLGSIGEEGVATVHPKRVLRPCGSVQ